MKYLLSIFIALCGFSSLAQNHYVLRGYVTNTNAEPLEGVYVRSANQGVGTITNENGQYELRILEGLNRVSYSFIGYQTQQLDLVIKRGVTQNIRLEVSENEIGTVEINNRRKDLSYDIIRQVIEKRAEYENQYTTQKRHIYIKSVERNTSIQKNKKEEEKKDEDVLEEPKDTSPNLNLFEGDFTQHLKSPSGFKEEKEAAKKLGSQRTLFYTSTTDADFNFNANLIYVKRLGDNQYISPISATALLAYKYKLLGSRYEGDLKIYTIRVSPRKMGNALFKGEIEVWDSLFTIKRVNLAVSKNSLILYDAFNIQQSYIFVDGKKVLDKENLTWTIKTKSGKSEGYCDVTYSQYVFDSLYSKRFFNAEIGTTKKDAYEKDTSFWAKIRPMPLTDEEDAYIDYQDSIKRLRTSKVYLDSIDSVFNKITFLKLAWNGFGHINREKKTLWSFDPAIGLINPIAIGGFRLRYGLSYYRKFENRKAIRIAPSLNYGFRNQDMKGNLSGYYLYNPKKLSSVSVGMGSDFGFVNNFATFADILNRSNFFVQKYVTATHRTELFNGFYSWANVRRTTRSDLGDFEFNPSFDSAFSNNNPQRFQSNAIVLASLGISYTPKQLYIQEPKEKIVIGSKFPTFQLYYSQAVAGVLGSKASFKELDFSINQKFNVGIFGQSEYTVSLGGFLDTSKLQIMDYRYQRGGDPIFLLPPMFGYQLIDSTFATFGAVLETHYTHQFNGFITSKIPGIKQLGVKTMVGGGLLVVPERDYQYSEILVGINRIFKIGKDRFRFGAYYVVGQSNTSGFSSGFKFSINPYNPETNSWSF